MWPTQALRRTTTNATKPRPLPSSVISPFLVRVPAPRPCSPRLLLSRPPAMHPTRVAARAHTCCDGRPPPHVDAVPLCCPPPTCDTEPFARLLHTRDAVPNGRSTRLRCSLGAVARRSVARHCGFVHPVCLGQQLPKHQLVGIGGASKWRRLVHKPAAHRTPCSADVTSRRPRSSRRSESCGRTTSTPLC